MRIGVFGRAGAGWLADVVHGAERAQMAGLDTFWANQAFALDGLTSLAVSAAAAPDIELGTAVIPIFTRHPQALAAQALTVQAACGGRLTLGIGLSHRHVVENRWGYSFERPVERMRQYLAALLPLLRGESPELHGELVTSTGALETGGVAAPPVLLGALGPAMLRLAGTVTEGTITAGTGPVTLASHIVPTIAAAAAAAGRPAPRIVACYSMAITDDRDRAARMRSQGLEHFQTFPSFRAMVEREGESGPVDLSIIGDEEEATRAVRRIEETGVTDLALFDASGEGEERERTWAFIEAMAGKQVGRCP